MTSDLNATTNSVGRSEGVLDGTLTAENILSVQRQLEAGVGTPETPPEVHGIAGLRVPDGVGMTFPNPWTGASVVVVGPKGLLEIWHRLKRDGFRLRRVNDARQIRRYRIERETGPDFPLFPTKRRYARGA